MLIYRDNWTMIMIFPCGFLGQRTFPWLSYCLSSLRFKKFEEYFCSQRFPPDMQDVANSRTNLEEARKKKHYSRRSKGWSQFQNDPQDIRGDADKIEQRRY